MAITADEIQDFLEEIIEIKKKEKQKGKRYKPEYYEGYQKAVEMAKDLAVHAIGEKPDRVVDKKVPNETEAQRQYRLQSMEPFTMPYWSKALNAIQGRIWNDSNYSVDKWKVEDEEDEEISVQKEYFEREFPLYGSIFNFFKSVRLPKKLYDSNAVMAVKPHKIPMFVNDEGELQPDDRQPIEAVTVIYDAWQVLKYNTKCTWIELREKSMVQIDDMTVKEGYIFEVYDDTNLWKITQIGEKEDWDFEIKVFYVHDLEKIPTMRLGGVPRNTETDDLPIFNSYFLPALGDLNTALFDESTLNISKISHTYPERWEVRSKCTNSRCDGGYVHNPRYDESKRQPKYLECPSCGGTGFKKHPLNTLVVTLPDRMDADTPETNPPTPPAGYLDKDIKTPEFLRTEINKKKEDAFANLNLYVGEKPNGQTATEKAIDREELFSMLLNIASEEFVALEFAILWTGAMVFGKDEFQLPNIDPPTDFTIRTYSELTEEISEARKQNMPVVAFRRLIAEYIQARFSQNKDLTRITDIVFYTDRLIMATEQEIILALNNGTASRTEVIVHQSIYTFIEQLMIENEDWIDLPIQDQQSAIFDKARVVEQMIGGNDAGQDILRELAAEEARQAPQA